VGQKRSGALGQKVGGMRQKRSTVSTPQFIAIVGITAVLFFLSLIPLEVIPEIPVDIDQKAFFIPFLLAATLALMRGGSLVQGPALRHFG
jgi:hypothetical protein